MDEQAPKQLPIGGKRAKMGSGRGRSAYLSLRLHPTDLALLRALAAQYQTTNTAVIEKALHLLAAHGTLKERLEDFEP